MKKINELMDELKQSVDLFKWYEGESSYYTKERVSNIVEEILQLDPDEKVRKFVITLEKSVYEYTKPMNYLERKCRAASAAWRNPLTSHVIY